MKALRPFIFAIAFFAMVFGLMVSDMINGENHRVPDPLKKRDFDAIMASDTLHVVMGYNSVNYFVYKGTPMGYQYELVQELCKHFGLFLDLTVTNDVKNAFQKLAFGKCDLIAMELTVAKNRFPRITFTDPLYDMRSILVQRKDSAGAISVTDLKQLDGKTVVIPRKTIYRRLLQKIEDSLNIDIHILPLGEIGTEDLCNLVAAGEISYTICDEHLARTLWAYYPELDFSIAVSDPMPVAWVVSSESVNWLAKLNAWIEEFKKKGNLSFLQRKYFDNPILYIFGSPDEHSLSGGIISKYDKVIKKYSEEIGWDWRLVSSLIYQESRFTTGFQSPSGAFGIMQMMPGTAQRMGVGYNSSAEEQIKGGVKLLHVVDTSFARYVEDKAERQKLVIAAYNIGTPHFYDAFELAKKQGRTPLTYEIVMECLHCKSKPEYYNDPVVKYGYINPWYVERFVKEIYARYNAYCAVFPEK
ncbi:Membrane-bound lytic murein transglycosylase F [bioreactor metagenome]|uniref:Membrane-bound lytic murein transglycosylase F n=1 Tax=bioreactor metagenome TaxID=1076179 RepID=A0A644WYE0_9ZZZZ